jgi:hypothetical protein
MIYYYQKSIKIPIYKGYLVLIFTNSIEKLNRRLPGINETNIYAHTYLYQYRGYEAAFIVLNFNHPEAITNGVISHESFHASNFIMANRNIDPDLNNDEPQAYLIAWITDQVHSFLQKQIISIVPSKNYISPISLFRKNHSDH